MLFEGNVNASSIEKNGAFKPCVELCPTCPRRTGERTVRAKGIKGWLGKKNTETVHFSPLKSGAIKSFMTNGRHGVFYGEGSENSGTVTGLKKDTAADFVKAVAKCEGPTDRGNVCAALGAGSLGAVYSLDSSMERAIDELPIAEIIKSMGSDSTKPPAADLPETQVFLNNSEPGPQ